ncbi:MAG: hypothetical protein AAGC71_05205 [Pseudomonadota bacterium]
MISVIKRGFVGIAVVLATGCVTNSNVIFVPEVGADVPFDYSATGVVTIQVADTTPFGGAYPINQVTFAPEDVEASEESKYLRARPLDDMGDTSRVFIAELPAGNYSISSLRTFHQFGESFFSQFYPGGVELGTFKVEPGKLTDLGVIVVYIKRSGDDYSFSTTRGASPNRANDHLRSALPGRASALKNLDEPLQWDEDGLEDDRYNAYLNAVNRQIALGLPDIDTTTGALTFPGPLGVMLTRTADHEWFLDAFDDDVEIRFYNKTDHGQWMVTEFNELYRRDTSDTDWSSVATPGATTENIVFVGDNVAGIPFAVTRSGDVVTIYAGSANLGEWQSIHQVESKVSFWTGGADLRFATYARSGDYLFLALRNKLYRYGIDSQSFSEVEGMSPASLQTRNGYITATAANFLGSEKVSFDKGGNWTRYRGDFIPKDEPAAKKNSRRTRLRAINIVGHPIFVDEKRAYAIHEGKGDADNFLISSTDGALTWAAREHAPLPEGCNSLVLATDNELLLGCFLTGEYYRSDDGGASWVLERDVSET